MNATKTNGNGGAAFTHQGLQSCNSAVQGLDHAIAEIADTNIPVLLIGESGTGKKFVAQQIHRLSSRRDEPFVKIACALLTAQTVSFYFGPNTEGNGASKQTPGSLLLEEISELDPSTQRNLLYALPDTDGDRAFEAPRILSSTSRNIEEEMRAGRFRNELYYRLNGACLRLVPLRQRKDDIRPLVEFFLAKYAALLKKPHPEIAPETIDLLHEYPWPGNIRELENTVKKIVALGDARLAVSDLSTASRHSQPAVSVPSGSPLKMAARAASHQAERQLILEALARTRWNRKRAAQELRISYKSLLYKLKQIGADEPETI